MVFGLGIDRGQHAVGRRGGFHPRLRPAVARLGVGEGHQQFARRQRGPQLGAGPIVGEAEEKSASTLAALEKIARAFGWDEETPLPRKQRSGFGFGPRHGFGRGHGFGPGHGFGHEHGFDRGHGFGPGRALPRPVRARQRWGLRSRRLTPRAILRTLRL